MWKLKTLTILNTFNRFSVHTEQTQQEDSTTVASTTCYMTAGLSDEIINSNVLYVRKYFSAFTGVTDLLWWETLVNVAIPVYNVFDLTRRRAVDSLHHHLC